MKEEKIKVLALLPMELPKEIDLDNTLEAMQKFVGGLIECITWRRRNLQPNVASIEKICSGFGITLSQFFQEEDPVYLTNEQKEILDLWAKLSPVQREAVTKMLCAFLYIEEEP